MRKLKNLKVFLLRFSWRFEAGNYKNTYSIASLTVLETKQFMRNNLLNLRIETQSLPYNIQLW